MNLKDLVINIICAGVFSIIWGLILDLEGKEFTVIYLFHILLFNQITIGLSLNKLE